MARVFTVLWLAMAFWHRPTPLPGDRQRTKAPRMDLLSAHLLRDIGWRRQDPFA